MSLATLLVMSTKPDPNQDPTFSFEHAQAHRTLLGSMSPLTRYSALPYLLSPNANNSGMWHRDHQQAHSDFTDTLPGYFGGFGFNLWGPIGGTGGTVSQQGPAYNIEDYDLTSEPALNWWTFQNHYAHLNAQQVQTSELWIFPFF